MAEYLPIVGAPVPGDGVPAFWNRRLPRYPGTTAAAEWIACAMALQFARRLEEPGSGKFWADALLTSQRPREFYQHDGLPLQLYTTNRHIADFLEGRAPVARAPWLSRIQTYIAQFCHGSIVKRRGERRPYFAPEDRPWRDKREWDFRPRGVPVYAQLVTPSENLRAKRLAEKALTSNTQAPLYTGW